MAIENLLIAFGSCLLAFLLLDGIWLGLIAKRFYNEQLGSLKRDKPLWLAAVIFYLMYIAGVTWLAVLPAITSGQMADAAKTGALIGFLGYGTYDMTNLATVKNWPWKLSVVDWAWGTFLTGVSAAFAYWMVHW